MFNSWRILFQTYCLKQFPSGVLFFSNNIFILLVFKKALSSKSTICFFLMFLNKDFTSKFFSLYFIDLLSKFFFIIDDTDISLLEWFIFSIVDFLKVDIDKLQRLLSIKTILLTCVCESWYAFVKWQSLLPFFYFFWSY